MKDKTPIYPGLLDIFVREARHEFLLTQPLTAVDIKDEAARILGKLQAPREPNSPSGTHFMAEVSPDFMFRAKSKDTDRLASLLPFKSLSLSTLNDRKAHCFFHCINVPKCFIINRPTTLDDNPALGFFIVI